MIGTMLHVAEHPAYDERDMRLPGADTVLVVVMDSEGPREHRRDETGGGQDDEEDVAPRSVQHLHTRAPSHAVYCVRPLRYGASRRRRLTRSAPRRRSDTGQQKIGDDAARLLRARTDVQKNLLRVCNTDKHSLCISPRYHAHCDARSDGCCALKPDICCAHEPRFVCVTAAFGAWRRHAGDPTV